MAGAFHKLLSMYPNVKEGIIKLVFQKNRGKPSQPIMRGKDIHERFIKLCKDEGITPEKGDYPFNTLDYGKRSLYRYIKDIKENNPQWGIKEFGKDAEMLYNNTGVGNKSYFPERPFERVEFDGHKINVVLAIKFTTLEGDEKIDIIDRAWLLTIVDSATRVILGYHFVLSKEYSAADVIICVRNAIMPWSPKNITIPGMKISENGGFASEVIPETKFAVWDEILFDNALANIAKQVESKLKNIVDCRVNTGPVGTPTRRPIVENLFHILDENGYNRITSTTGNHPNDPRRQYAEKKAIKYEITPDEIEQLTEVLIANRNGTRQTGLSGLTPLETMQQRINRKMPFRLLKEEFRDGYEFLTIELTRVIRGKMETGRRPYVRFEGVDYRNDVLSEGFNLVGTKITLIINIEDLRLIKAFLPDGSELGLLKATGKWAIRKHSLKMRKIINKLIKEGEIVASHEDDPVEVFHNYLVDKSKKSKKARTELASYQRDVNSELVTGSENKSVIQTNDENQLNNTMEKSSSNVYSINEKMKRDSSKKHYQNRERFFFNS